MKYGKKLLSGMIFLIGIMASMLFVSSASYSNPQFISPSISTNHLSSQGINLYPIFDSKQCGAGQDFIVQVAPFGCSPSVVRSDLLEEQNVPVFCQLQATQINPLIKVNAIDKLSFQGDYSKGISGIGYYPAQAAVKSRGTTLLNSPVLGNIGYAVIVLKQQPNESSMPDFVDGNLTATIKYNIEDAFGIGKATYYLPELDNFEWDEKYKQYGFWNGKGFLRVEGIDSDNAVVSVYLNKEQKISSVNLKKGQTSNKIYLPGFFCQAGLQLRLDSLDAPDTRAKLNINGNIVEVADGERFLDNACYVRSLEEEGISQNVGVSCRTDDGVENFVLKISPKVNLEIDGKPVTAAVGDYLYQSSGKYVYLAYAGTKENSGNEKDLFVYFMEMPQVEEKLSKEEISSANTMVKMLTYQKYTGVGVIDFTTNIFKTYGAVANRAARYAIEGKRFYGLGYNAGGSVSGAEDVFGKKVRVYGFESPKDDIKSFENDKNSKQNYDFAMNEYRTIINQYPNEKEDSNSQETYGERALLSSIKLAKQAEQKKTMAELCKEFAEKYPESSGVPDYCENSLKISNSEISSKSIFLNGNVKEISFEGVYEPTWDDYSAEVLVRNSGNGESNVFLLRKNEVVYLKDSMDIYSLKFSGSTPIYYRYSNNRWQWSPDKIYWMESSYNTEPRAEAGGYIGAVPVSEQVWVINALAASTFEEGISLLSIKNAVKEQSSESIQLISLSKGTSTKGDSAVLNVNLDSTTFIGAVQKAAISSSRKTLKKDIGDSFGSKYTFTLIKVNVKNQAKVSVIPTIDNAKSETNVSFKIGIEKRGIQLSPGEIKDRIKTLDDSIGKWESTSDSLGSVVEGLNAACLTTGTYLTVKNFFTNMDGKSIARQEIMTESGGWTDICKSEIASTKESLDSCFLRHSKEIDADVDAVFNVIQSQDAITDSGLCGKLSEIQSSLGNKVTNGRTEKRNIKELEISPDLKAAFSPDDETGKCEKVSLTQAKDLERLNKIIDSGSGVSQQLRQAAEMKRYALLNEINANVRNLAEYNKFLDDIKKQDWISGAKNVDFQSSDRNPVVGNYGGAKTVKENGNISIGELIQPISFNNDRYYVTLKDNGGNSYSIQNVYDEDGTLLKDDNPKVGTIKSRFGKGFKKYDENSYTNKFINPEVSYFETEPYKGRPALVPFDTTNGWYTAMKQTLPGFGNIRAYDDSGQVSSFYLCNVGENGKAEFNSGVGDDICQQFNPGTGLIAGIFPGLDSGKTNILVSKAISAINDASRAYKPGLTGMVRIGRESIRVGKPAVNVPEFQCQNFMSPTECNLLFNVCDPVVCPSSRCDLGGSYPVADVVQSGIVGSSVLCLPNFPDVKIPVCLSGVKAGIDGLISVQKNYRDCLKTNLDTGKTVGICDEIHSIYLCDFFWSQAAPFAQVAIPKIIEVFAGQTKPGDVFNIGASPRGGGEYLGVQSAWQNAKDSTDYMAQYYRANSFQAFKAQATEGIGKAVCQNFVSATYPSDVGLSSLIKPRSPPQFHAWFSEETYTTATIPATSQYKAFYHIYAGKGYEGSQLAPTGYQNYVQYSVYLKSTTKSLPVLFVTIAGASAGTLKTLQSQIVRSSTIKRGEFVQQSINVRGEAGYDQICVVINGKTSCGFGKASSAFGMKALQDSIVYDEANRGIIGKEITTSDECRPDYPRTSPSLGSLTMPQQFGMLNTGIIRVCNPTPPGPEDIWRPVGDCGNDKNNKYLGKCWLNLESIKLNDAEKAGKLATGIENKSREFTGVGDFIIPIDESKFALAQLNGKRSGLMDKLRNSYDSLKGKFKGKIPKQEPIEPTAKTGTGEVPNKEDDNVQGGCRYDGIFEYKQTNILIGEEKIKQIAETLKSKGIKSVYVYGFASIEGDTKYNSGLSLKRANTIKDLLEKNDLSVEVKGLGETITFDEGEVCNADETTKSCTSRLKGSESANRRFVISTKQILSESTKKTINKRSYTIYEGFKSFTEAGSTSNCESNIKTETKQTTEPEVKQTTKVPKANFEGNVLKNIEGDFKDKKVTQITIEQVGKIAFLSTNDFTVKDSLIEINTNKLDSSKDYRTITVYITGDKPIVLKWTEGFEATGSVIAITSLATESEKPVPKEILPTEEISDDFKVEVLQAARNAFDEFNKLETDITKTIEGDELIKDKYTYEALIKLSADSGVTAESLLQRAEFYRKIGEFISELIGEKPVVPLKPQTPIIKAAFTADISNKVTINGDFDFKNYDYFISLTDNNDKKVYINADKDKDGITYGDKSIILGDKYNYLTGNVKSILITVYFKGTTEYPLTFIELNKETNFGKEIPKEVTKDPSEKTIGEKPSTIQETSSISLDAGKVQIQLEPVSYKGINYYYVALDSNLIDLKVKTYGSVFQNDGNKFGVATVQQYYNKLKENGENPILVVNGDIFGKTEKEGLVFLSPMAIGLATT